MRHTVGRGQFIPKEERHGRGERRAANDLARHFVVEMIIVGAMSKDDVGTNAAKKRGGFGECLLVVYDEQVAFVQAMIGSTDQSRCRGAFAATNSADLLGRVFRRSTVAG